jgi:hypothetical protein
MESPNEPSVDRADFAWSANHAGFSIVSTRAKYALRAKRLMSTLNGDIPGAPAQSDLVSSDDLENRIQKMRESYDKAEAVSVSKVGQIANVANRAGCSDTAWYAVDAKEAQFAVHVTGLKGSDYDSPSTGASS